MEMILSVLLPDGAPEGMKGLPWSDECNMSCPGIRTHRGCWAGDSDDNTDTTFPQVSGSSRLYCTMVVWYYGSVESITRSTAEWVQ